MCSHPRTPADPIWPPHQNPIPRRRPFSWCTGLREGRPSTDAVEIEQSFQATNLILKLLCREWGRSCILLHEGCYQLDWARGTRVWPRVMQRWQRPRMVLRRACGANGWPAERGVHTRWGRRKGCWRWKGSRLRREVVWMELWGWGGWQSAGRCRNWGLDVVSWWSGDVTGRWSVVEWSTGESWW